MNERDFVIQSIIELLAECEDIELIQLILSMLRDTVGLVSPAH